MLSLYYDNQKAHMNHYSTYVITASTSPLWLFLIDYCNVYETFLFYILRYCIYNLDTIHISLSYRYKITNKNNNKKT